MLECERQLTETMEQTMQREAEAYKLLKTKEEAKKEIKVFFCVLCDKQYHKDGWLFLLCISFFLKNFNIFFFHLLCS